VFCGTGVFSLGALVFQFVALETNAQDDSIDLTPVTHPA
jgi:hypothetical protein